MCSRPQFSDLIYIGGTGPCDSLKIFFGNHVYSQHTISSIKFSVNGMCSRPQYTDLTTMGGTGFYGPMTIIFCSVIQSQHTSLNITFCVNRTFHVLKTLIYRFDLYGRCRTLWTDDDNFWQCYKELAYKPKYQIWCESDVPCAQDPVYRFDLYGRYRTLQTDDDYFSQCH